MNTETVYENREILWEFWQTPNEAGPHGVADVVRHQTSAATRQHSVHARNDLNMSEALLWNHWRLLPPWSPNPARDCEVLNGRCRHRVGAVGHLTGTFAHDARSFHRWDTRWMYGRSTSVGGLNP